MSDDVSPIFRPAAALGHKQSFTILTVERLAPAKSSHRYVHSRIDSYPVSANIDLTKAELRVIGIVMRHVLDPVLGTIAIVRH